MATVQSYTKSGVDAKFNSRSNMTMVHNGGGTPDLSAYPDSKTGDVIERSSDGARWGVVASTLTPVASRVVSVAGKKGVVNLVPGDVGAAPANHTHTKAQITDLNASATATGSSIAQRDSLGRLVVETPANNNHAADKAYVDTQIRTGVTWGNVSDKPATYAPSSHTHAVSDIPNLPAISTLVTNGAIVQRSSSGHITVPDTPTRTVEATSKLYVDTQITASKAWSAITGKPSTYAPSTHSHTQAQVTGLPAKLTTYDTVVSKVNSASSNVSGSTTNAGSLVALSSTGRLTAVNPSGTTDVANKQYVDSEISAKTTWANTSGKPSTFTPSAHSHTMANITNLPAISTLESNDTLVKRDSAGRVNVNPPIWGNHATTKKYVDDAITDAKAWSAITGKPATFAPSTHTHSLSDLPGLPAISTQVTNSAIVQRSSTGHIVVPDTPTRTSEAASKLYVDDSFKSTNVTTENLNDMQTPGNYFQGYSVEATTARNYPEGARAGHLVVLGIGGNVKQEYTDFRSGSMYYRTLHSNTWYPWQSITQTEV